MLEKRKWTIFYIMPNSEERFFYNIVRYRIEITRSYKRNHCYNAMNKNKIFNSPRGRKRPQTSHLHHVDESRAKKQTSPEQTGQPERQGRGEWSAFTCTHQNCKICSGHDPRVVLAALGATSALLSFSLFLSAGAFVERRIKRARKVTSESKGPFYRRAASRLSVSPKVCTAQLFLLTRAAWLWDFNYRGMVRLMLDCRAGGVG